MEDEHIWVQQIVAGDEAGCRQVMNRYGTAILRVSTLLLKDLHLAEDVAQETFLQAFRSIRQYQAKGSLKNWLIKIAVNQCRARIRKASWRRLIFSGDDTYIARQESHEDQPEAAYFRHEIRDTIGRLPYQYREVIVLFYYQQLSIAEICEQLGEREGTIKSRLSRGRQLCKKLLEQGGWHSETIG